MDRAKTNVKEMVRFCIEVTDPETGSKVKTHPVVVGIRGFPNDVKEFKDLVAKAFKKTLVFLANKHPDLYEKVREGVLNGTARITNASYRIRSREFEVFSEEHVFTTEELGFRPRVRREKEVEQEFAVSFPGH